MLVDECRQRSKNLADLAGFDELKSSKFMTRNDVEEKLDSFRRSRDHRPEWSAVASHLHLPFAEENRIEREWRNYEISRLDRAYATTIEFGDKIKHAIDPIMNRAATLWDGVNAAVPVVRGLVTERYPGKSDDFVSAVILFEFKR